MNPQGIIGAKHISDVSSNARMIPYLYHQSCSEAAEDAPHFTAVQLSWAKLTFKKEGAFSLKYCGGTTLLSSYLTDLQGIMLL